MRDVAHFLTDHCTLYVPVICICLKNEHGAFLETVPNVHIEVVPPETFDLFNCWLCIYLIGTELLAHVYSTASSGSTQLQCVLSD